MSLSRRSLLTSTAAVGGLGLLPGLDPAALAAPSPRRSSLARFAGTGFTGTHAGTAATAAGLVMARAIGTEKLVDVAAGRTIVEDRAVWTGPVVATTLPATQLIASWNAATPLGSAVRIELRARTASGRWSRWFTMGLWASSSAAAQAPTRTSARGQSDALAKLATDTVKAAAGVTFSHHQLRVTLLRAHGLTVRPSLAQLCVVASTTPPVTTAVSAPGVGRGKVLAVPAHSQMLHLGHYPAWNGGGEAWCSATSTAMVLEYFGVGASAAETAWVRPRPHVDAQVEQVVRGVWDAGYQGTGNWPFNVAYAHARGLSGFVTRLRHLADAEAFIAAGLPLVVSTSFTRAQLTGAGFGTAGHLMVIRGFDARGNVLVNDPASMLRPSNVLVAKTYDRAQFESAWGRSGGTTYVMYPAGHALPRRTPGAAW